MLPQSTFEGRTQRASQKVLSSKDYDVEVLGFHIHSYDAWNHDCYKGIWICRNPHRPGRHSKRWTSDILASESVDGGSNNGVWQDSETLDDDERLFKDLRPFHLRTKLKTAMLPPWPRQFSKASAPIQVIPVSIAAQASLDWLYRSSQDYWALYSCHDPSGDCVHHAYYTSRPEDRRAYRG